MSTPRRALPLLTAALMLLFAISACETDEDRGIGVSVDQIVDDPEAFYGSRVTVSGEVNDIYNATTFTIGGGEFDEELLILSLDTIAAVAGRTEEEPVRAYDVVQVTGTVRQLVAGDFTDEFGVDLGDIDDEFEGRPVLVARTGSAQLPSIVVSARGRAARPPTEEQLVDDFERAAGAEGRELMERLVRFNDLDVAQAVGDHSFWATSEGSDSLFVILTHGSVAANEGGVIDTTQSWDVYGILRDVPPANEIAAGWDLDERTIQRLGDEAVYLQAVYAMRSPAVGPLTRR